MMILGFSWGGWVLDSTAKSMARDQVNAAVVAVFTPICVEKFMAQPEATMKLVELQKTAAWNQPNPHAHPSSLTKPSAWQLHARPIWSAAWSGTLLGLPRKT
jgi:alpha/beta superfamily hydrolase